ncbi:MAG: hypothetical protein Q8T13_20640 [Acidobacteriota bacterium]|nr:hypothetical protein [Acidobacteriota bacterium]
MKRDYGFRHVIDSANDHAFKQFRLSRFGLVVALVSLGFVVLTFLLSLWLDRARRGGCADRHLRAWCRRMAA